jgi:cysteine desulfurase family protein (TIGR01976 family)
MSSLDVTAIRERFPALRRALGGRPVVYFDGPAGSQVPESVIEAVARTLRDANANSHGAFATSREVDALLEDARAACADLLGAPDRDCIAFGQNMTSLTFALSRSMMDRWDDGDEIVVTRLDHDANVWPWVTAARDAGARIRYAGITPSCTLDLDELRSLLSDRTRLVAIGAASNAVGTINPVKEICALAHDAGAEVFVDAVHYAPHGLIDVVDWDCDYLACSAYKFFGPHIGMLWGKRETMRSLPAYQVRPAGDELPNRWMTGTQSHEAIAGTLAAIEYIASLGEGATRRDAVVSAYRRIAAHERALTDRMLAGLSAQSSFTTWGAAEHRAPTFGITHASRTAEDIAQHLGERGIFVWHGNFYALELTTALDLEPDGMVRIGLLHYNTEAEVDRLLDELRELG